MNYTLGSDLQTLVQALDRNFTQHCTELKYNTKNLSTLQYREGNTDKTNVAF